MLRFARYAGVVAAVAALSGTASAASLFFSSQGPGNVPGVIRVDMWYVDATRVTPIQALQFDLDIVGGSSLVPGSESEPNVVMANPVTPAIPWDLNQDIGDPVGAIDVRTVLASSDVFDIQGLHTQLSTGGCLGPLQNCAGVLAGLAGFSATPGPALYLGSFSLNYDGRAVFLKLSGIVGEDDNQPQDGTDDIVLALRFAATQGNCADPRGCRVDGLAPEPTGLVLMGLTLAGLSFARRRD